MDLRQLEYYVRVAELGSFTRAAQALGVSQPALSRQIRLLEVDLRQTLLVRNGRGATPSPAGELLLEHGRGILHQVARAREALGRARGVLDGRVAVGLPPTIARAITVPLTRAFRAHLPHGRLSISEGLSTAMQAGLVSGRLDLALVYDAQPADGVEFLPLMDEALMWIERRTPRAAREATNVRPGRPVTLTEIAPRPLVIPSRPNAIRMLVESAYAAAGLQPRILLEIDGISAILDLVADGAGGAILPRQALGLTNRPSLFRVRPILRADRRESLSVRLSMATSRLRPITPTQTATQDLIREVVAAMSGSA